MLTTEQIKQTVTEYFKDKPVKKVYLFGSYARGDAKEDSDVDLSVVLSDDAKITYITLAGYLVDLEKSLKRKIDLVEEKMIYKQLKPFIERSKILILDK
jgi:predicted nucleotidyltransferase